MTYRLELEIPGLPPGLNGSQSNWRVKAGIRKQWRRLASLAVGHRAPPRPLANAKLTLIRCSTRPMDWDNAAASLKPLVDGLRDAGVIADDGPDVIGQPVMLWEKAKRGEGKVRIIVEEVCET